VNVTLGKEHMHLMSVTDPDARLYEVAERKYRLFVPSSYKEGTPMPLFLYYHGQCDDVACSSCIWKTLAEEHGFMFVLPVGLNDRTGCVNWNVGSCGRTDVCTPKCEGTTSQSCKITGNSSNCNWSTCYDDFHFATLLMEQLQSTLCIDQSQIFLSGSSNGGMFGYQLASRLPIFAGFVPWYGAFLKNMEQAPPPVSTRPVTLFAMHGLKDVTLPWTGGQSYDHYLYVSGNETQEVWRNAEGCGPEEEAFETPWNNATSGQDDDEDFPMRFACSRYTNCGRQHQHPSSSKVAPPAVVARCLWPDQAHGFVAVAWERLTWWALTGQLHANDTRS
jgi:poly(3-hydroxybutyrate) depolymerase